MRAYKFGVIGLGAIGRRHLENLRQCGFEVVGAVRGQGPDVPIFDDMDALISQKKPAALVVASPNALHHEHVLCGLNAGCHILCEKPLGIDRTEVIEMAEAARNSGRALMGGFNLRFLPHTHRAIELVQEGAIGNILRVSGIWKQHRGIPGPGKWHTTKKMAGGGVLLDYGVHVLDIAWVIMGRPRPVSVSATLINLFTGRLHEYKAENIWNGPMNPSGIMDVEDGCKAIFRFENNAVLELDVAWASNEAKRGLEIILKGERGEMCWHKNGMLMLREDRNEPIPVKINTVYANMYQQFVGTVQGAPNPCSPDEMIIVAAMLDAAYASANTGSDEPVLIPENLK